MQIKNPTIVIDARFYISSLNGFPKAYVNFVLDTIEIEGILKLTEDKDRYCEFKSCLAYMDEKLTEPKYFIDISKGKLSDKPQGKMQKHLWSNLSKIFIPKNYKKILAEMTYDEYSTWLINVKKEHSNEKQLYNWLYKNIK